MKNEKKKTLIFIWKYIDVGGIQTYLLRTIKYLKKNGHRIIWIFPKGGYISEIFKQNFVDGSIEIIEVKFENFCWIGELNVRFDEAEEVSALTFNLFDFVFVEMIKNKYKKVRIDSFFWVPHFKEKFVFVEEFAPKFLQPMLRKYIGKIIYSMEKNNNIIYVNQSHLDALTQTYNYKIENEKEKLLIESNREVLPYDNNLTLERSKREVFNIITVTRFSIPHKAYILGLIKVYGELKQKYDKLRLTIIGYGQDEDKVINEIEKLPISIKKDLIYVGKVAYDNLRKYFVEAHLNIGVAGTIGDGALTGLISIPVRHYSKKCEGYGYLPESRNHTTSSEPGVPIEKFIEQVINMDRSRYIELSRKSYDTYATDENNNATVNLLAEKNKNPYKTLKNRYILFVRIGFKFGKMIKRNKINAK